MRPLYRERFQRIKNSLISLLSGTAESVHSDDSHAGLELYGHRAIRQGEWKIVWDPALGDNVHWMTDDVIGSPGIVSLNPDGHRSSRVRRESTGHAEDEPVELRRALGF
jgi:hypothetical protein